MTKQKLLFFILCIGVLSTYGQTVTKAQMPISNQSYTYYVDTLLKLKIPVSGNLQQFNFSGLQNHYTHVLEFLNNPKSSFLEKQFMSCDIKANSAYSNGGVATDRFFESTNEHFYHLGSIIGGSFLTKGVNPWVRFPLTSSSKFEDSLTTIRTPYLMDYDPDDAGPLPKVDSLKYTKKYKEELIGFASGMLKLPVNQYNVVWQKIIQINTYDYQVYYNNAWSVPSPELIEALNQRPAFAKTVSYNAWAYDNQVQGYVFWADEEGDSMKNIEWAFNSPMSVGQIDKITIKGFPNPATKNVSFETVSNLVNAIAYDVNGKMINLRKMENTEFDISMLSTGIYTVIVFDDEEKQFISKIQVQ